MPTYELTYTAQQLEALGGKRVENKTIKIAARSADQALDKLQAELRKSGYLLLSGKIL